jgi:hypothetical protein
MRLPEWKGGGANLAGGTATQLAFLAAKRRLLSWHRLCSTIPPAARDHTRLPSYCGLASPDLRPTEALLDGFGFWAVFLYTL